MITSKLKLFAAGGLAVLIISLVGGLAQQTTRLADTYKEVASLNQTVSVQQVAIAGYVKTIEDLQDETARQLRISMEYQELIINLEHELKEKNADIERYKGRQSTVLAKPGLVEKLERKALGNFFDDVANIGARHE